MIFLKILYLLELNILRINIIITMNFNKFNFNY